jgi:hypothetical protein
MKKQCGRKGPTRIRHAGGLGNLNNAEAEGAA